VSDDADVMKRLLTEDVAGVVVRIDAERRMVPV
jgi:hypothetical protein